MDLSPGTLIWPRRPWAGESLRTLGEAAVVSTAAVRRERLGAVSIILRVEPTLLLPAVGLGKDSLYFDVV
jgi:hypothetical protein